MHINHIWKELKNKLFYLIKNTHKQNWDLNMIKKGYKHKNKEIG